MTTDYASSFEKSMIKMVGYDLTVNAARKVYEQAGVGPKDVQVCELHDCFTANEILSYEALGLCQEGEAERLHLGRQEHLRRVGGDEPLGGAPVEGASARGNGRGAVRGARVAAPRAGGQASGAGCEGRAAAQPRPGRGLRRDDVQEELSEAPLRSGPSDPRAGEPGHSRVIRAVVRITLSSRRQLTSTANGPSPGRRCGRTSAVPSRLGETLTSWNAT